MKTELILAKKQISYGETRTLPGSATLDQIAEFDEYLQGINVQETFDVIFDVEVPGESPKESEAA